MRHAAFFVLAMSSSLAFAPASAAAQADRFAPRSKGPATEQRLQHAGSSSRDLRDLPARAPKRRELPAHDAPPFDPVALPDPLPAVVDPVTLAPTANAPAPTANFAGLDHDTWGAGYPPDANGDVGPTYFIEAVDASIGIFDKASGMLVSAFTFDTFMSQGSFGNPCDTDNAGDPVVLYDSFEGRWIITDVAYQLDGSNNVVAPPGAFECIAVSKTADPVAGGWNFYSLATAGGLGGEPKLGVWPDGLYLSVNLRDYAAGNAFQNPRLYALNKAQMYAGATSVQGVAFDAPGAEYSMLPANARLQAGTPPAGTPNYFSVAWQTTNAVSVYKFHVDWQRISTSTLTGPFLATAPANWTAPPATVAAPGGNTLDPVGVRLMAQTQYANVGGVESLWAAHTVQSTAASLSAPRFYQIGVTGGSVASNTLQAGTYSSSAISRFVPSVAVDRAGNVLMGYGVSSSSVFPAIRYAGRLAGDPATCSARPRPRWSRAAARRPSIRAGAPTVRWRSTPTAARSGWRTSITSRTAATGARGSARCDIRPTPAWRPAAAALAAS
jgi:hypothetical protein